MDQEKRKPMSLRERAQFLAMERPTRTDADELAARLDDLLAFVRSADSPRGVLDNWTAVLSFLNKHSRTDVERLSGN